MTTLIEIIQLYEELVRKNYITHYTLNSRSKNYPANRKAFVKLKSILESKNIDAEDFLRVQFQTKGQRPFPNQLHSKAAIDRYITYDTTRDVEGLHIQQETYLKMFVGIGYTVEEALQFHCFYYYFRCMYIKDHPKEWKLKAKQEIDVIPELKKIIKERKR
jgi:hypothetical protein